MTNLIITKVIVALLLGILRFVFGLLPIKAYCYLINWGEQGDTEIIHAERRKYVECLVTRCQSFGGGVLFATCFLHMIQEVRKCMDELYHLLKISNGYIFPFSELIISIGFFMIYFIEEFAHWVITKVNPSTSPGETPKKYLSEEEKVNDDMTNGKTVSEIVEKGESDNVVNDNSVKYTEIDNISDHGNTESVRRNLSNSAKSTVTLKTQSDGNPKSAKSQRTIFSLKSPTMRMMPDGHFSELTEDNSSKNVDKKSYRHLRGFLVLIALSCHSIFEGLSIGLQKHASNIWFMFIAISVHAGTILFCIGFEMVLDGVRSRIVLITMVILAMVSPIGVIIGLVITIEANPESKSLLISTVLLEGFSTGTLLYITFFEVLNREKSRRANRISRSVCMIGGFLAMAILQTAE